MKKYPFDELKKKYGDKLLTKAVNYFIRKGKHCTIVELENKCKEYAGTTHNT